MLLQEFGKDKTFGTLFNEESDEPTNKFKPPIQTLLLLEQHLIFNKDYLIEEVTSSALATMGAETEALDVLRLSVILQT